MAESAETKGGGAGSDSEAFPAIVSALENAAHARVTDATDPNVSVCFALGWEMSALYERCRNPSPPTGHSQSDLPGVGSLDPEERLALLGEQIRVGAEKVQSVISAVGLDPVDLTALDGLAPTQAGAEAVLALHVQLLTKLTAAESRLGKAYGLGRALADTCREPSDAAGLGAELAYYRIANLLAWLDDLSSVLPPHAASSVCRSLGRWRDAIYPPDPAKRKPETFREWIRYEWRYLGRRGPSGVVKFEAGDATVPALAADIGTTLRALRRQGELWRALLCGEKEAKDMLEIGNYISAASQMLRRTAAIVRSVTFRMPLLTCATLALTGGGIYLLSKGGSSHLVAGATSVLVAFGLTWKGVGGALGRLAGRLEQPLWGAVLDDAIADAITLLPGNRSERGGKRQVALATAAGELARESRAQ